MAATAQFDAKRFAQLVSRFDDANENEARNALSKAREMLQESKVRFVDAIETDIYQDAIARTVKPDFQRTVTRVAPPAEPQGFVWRVIYFIVMLQEFGVKLRHVALVLVLIAVLTVASIKLLTHRASPPQQPGVPPAVTQPQGNEGKTPVPDKGAGGKKPGKPPVNHRRS